MSPEVQLLQDNIAESCRARAAEFMQSLGHTAIPQPESAHVKVDIYAITVGGHHFVAPEVHDKAQEALRAKFHKTHPIPEADSESHSQLAA